MADLNSRALVTGGSRGIGAGIALALARAGADVAVNYRERAYGTNAISKRRLVHDLVGSERSHEAP